MLAAGIFIREYPSEHMTDPVYSDDFGFKQWVIRGGGFLDSQWHVTSSMRRGVLLNTSKNTTGFRVVKVVDSKDILKK